MSATIPRGRRRKILFRLTALLIATVIAIGLAEFGLSRAGFGYPILYEPDEFCGSRLRARAEGWWNREGKVYVRINSDGFRGEETSRQKPDNIYRIAVLGDSFMEALQVDLKDTFCERLERWLNVQAADGREYEVLNFGVSGYGATQQLLMLRHHVLPFDPDAVVLAFFPGNDIRNNHRQLERDQSRPYFVRNRKLFRLDRSFLTSSPYVTACSTYESMKSAVVNRSSLLQILMHTKQTWGQEQLVAVDPQNVEDVSSRLRKSVAESSFAYGQINNGIEEEAWTTTEWVLTRIAEETRTRKLPFAIFTVSTPAMVWPEKKLRDGVFSAEAIDNPFYAEERLNRLCAQAGVEFLPLASRLQKVVDVSDVWLHGFKDSGIGFGHWNPAGHQLAAETTGPWLQAVLAGWPRKRITPIEEIIRWGD